MKIAAAIEKMTDFYKGNIHDIYHFLKVWAFAKNIGEAEGLDPKTQETLEMAAVVHDIACPLCREKYGNTSKCTSCNLTNPKYIFKNTS